MFKETLNQLIDTVRGAEAAFILNAEGTQLASTEVGLSDEASKEYATIFNQLISIKDDAGLGEAEDFLLESLDNLVIVHPLSDRYCLALRLSPEGCVHRARFHIRAARPSLTQAL
ncbi:roadblock/LC7 domain-containing protein [Myxococcota bacterium]|nr:roadblock/LC7 domain-containing protein [Myxococcota bacterium]MBU1429345.1 roadblock/LC7 domain-containing protein [Myxococcota bacterium]MBU1899597.1 roadblock/LC7 domain-containing protein [Myxococcota bacterium]